MTDREKKIAEIREALEKATPGPWHMSKLSAGYLVDDRGKDITVFIEYNEDGSVHMEFENWQNNSRLIANAPEWLRFLLDELDRQRTENKELCERKLELRKSLDESDQWFKKASENVQRLEKERDKLIEGLHNYMKELDRRYQKAYRNYDIDCDHHQLGMAEAYEVAERCLRDILHEIGVTVE